MRGDAIEVVEVHHRCIPAFVRVVFHDVKIMGNSRLVLVVDDVLHDLFLVLAEHDGEHFGRGEGIHALLR